MYILGAGTRVPVAHNLRVINYDTTCILVLTMSFVYHCNFRINCPFEFNKINSKKLLAKFQLIHKYELSDAVSARVYYISYILCSFVFLFCFILFYFWFINESSFFGQLNNPLYKKVVFVLFNLAKNANILY
jgi:hypothetical protein